MCKEGNNQSENEKMDEKMKEKKRECKKKRASYISPSNSYNSSHFHSLNRDETDIFCLSLCLNLSLSFLTVKKRG